MVYYLLGILFFVVLGFLLGLTYFRLTAGMSVLDDDKFVSSCCGCSVVEKPTKVCLCCGDECKIKSL